MVSVRVGVSLFVSLLLALVLRLHETWAEMSDGWLREARSKTGRAFFQSRGQGIGCVARVELRASWDICRVASERACFARMGGVVRRQHCVAQNPPPPVGYSKARSGMGGKVHTDRRTALSHEKEQGLGEFRPIRALLAVC